MGDGTGIEWTDTTWNPVRGCSRVSEGCRHCYAETMAGRFSGPGQPYEGLVKLVSREARQFKMVNGEPTGDFRTVTRSEARWTGVVRMVPEHLADPLRWRRPRRVFVNSMSDLFHEALTNEQIAAVFGVMAAAPRHTFQVLTKRAERMRDWFRWIERAVDRQRSVFPTDSFGWLAQHVVTNRARHFGAPASVKPDDTWPLPNVWLGVSVENQAAADERIPLLLKTPAVVRFLSCEPLLGPVHPAPFTVGRGTYCHDCGGPGVKIDEDGCCATCGADAYWYGVDWIIAGCESGRSARPAEVGWYRALRDQCAAAGVPYFLKQMMVDGRKVGTPELDGRRHVEFPA